MLIKSMSKNGMILTVFALATTGTVTLTHIFTKPTIAHQEQKQLMNTLNQVIDAKHYNNELYLDCTEVTASELNQKGLSKIYRASFDGKPVALLISSVAPDGYSGDIEILSAVFIDGTVSGVRVLKHKETPGLGDKVELSRSNWITSFNGLKVVDDNDTNWQVKKDGGQFDQFTGATITPRAVVKAVKQASLFTQSHYTEVFNKVNLCGASDE